MTDQALDDLFRQVLLDAVLQEESDLMKELPDHDFSPDFNRKMKKLLHRADHPIRYRVLQTVACFLVAIVLLGGSVLTFSAEARDAFMSWVREMYETWFVYRYTGEAQPTVDDMVYLPTWIPEGYEKTVSPEVGIYVRTQYENSAKDLLTFSYVKGTETTSLNVQWEGAIVRQTSVGHLSADLYLNPNDGPNILVWTDLKRDVAFWITAPLTEKELVRVAESVQESDPIPKRYCVSLLPMNYGAYSIASETEEDGRGETVYENDQGFFITFGYSHDPAFAPQPKTESSTVTVWDAEAKLYPASKAGGDKTILWTAEDGATLWVCSPLPDDEMLQIAENVQVQINQFSDLTEIQLFDSEAPLMERVKQALTNSFVAQVEDCAKQDAHTGNYMSEKFNTLWMDQQNRYVSPERDDAIARVTALADSLWQEGWGGESIVSLFGPFYTASIHVSDFDDESYKMLADSGLLEYYSDATANIVDERGVMIAGYNFSSTKGKGESFIVPTAEEMQFQYEVRQIYMKAYQEALSALSNEE